MGIGPEVGQLSEPLRPRWGCRKQGVPYETQVTVNKNLFLKHWQWQALRGLSGEFWTAGGPMRIDRSDRFTGLKCITIFSLLA